MSDNFLEVENVKTYFPIWRGVFFPHKVGEVKAVDNVSIHLKKGEILGLVGESGCGKSTLGKTIMRLVKMTEGKVTLDGQNLHELDGGQLRAARPNFQMIFQDPYASLDPRMTVFDALAEPLLIHGFADGKNVGHKVAQLMEKVGLASRFMKKYPHEFSGGQRQRIAIARALALDPKLIIADEPVSALDVSIQSQIINLLLKLTRELGLTMIFISHDLSVVKYISDRIAVMYLGKIVETGKTKTIFESPQHPYTNALLSAVPLPDPDKEKDRKRILLEGDPPSPINPPSGCRFNPRCPYRKPECEQTDPKLEMQSSGSEAACIRIGEF